MEAFAYDLGSGSWQNMYIVFGFDEANPLTYSDGPFVGGAQAWRFQTFDSKTRGGISTVASGAEALSPGKWYHVKVMFNDYGALITQEALHKAERQIAHFVDKGAEITYGDNPRISHPDEGYLMRPVLLEIDAETLYKNSELRNIEIFAPVSVMVKAKDFEQALEIEDMGAFALADVTKP